ncbi:MAG: cytochrome d ubiquinol oxidase subunit II [Dysgonamonadaceae bacterium]|jgi:cytochrome d ubiquinol oxidase subunit II|nr:cytochrome d ubiquinol oxidase subunit II [Dysgonamonadaceae bacterium]
MDYSFYQHYWWFLLSLLGGILVFLLFVQGGQSLIYTLGKKEDDLKLLIGSLGRKWELTFTTLVTFGAAFFASFPLFYTISFSGAYWVWMLILFSFVIQAVSYEFISKKGNFLGRGTYKAFLFLNGLLGPVLLGTAVSTLFFGAEFKYDPTNLTNAANPTFSEWQGAFWGLEAIWLTPWNVVFGLAVFFLARTLGALYIINNIDRNTIQEGARRQVLINAILFLVLFLPYLINLLFFHPIWKFNLEIVDAGPYFNNLLAAPWTLVLLTVGVASVLYGFYAGALTKHTNGIWYAGAGTVFVVLSLLFIAGVDGTIYYRSLSSPVYSLTIYNSSSSEFTLKAMSTVSLFIPAVLAYIWYVWRKMDAKTGENHLS